MITCVGAFSRPRQSVGTSYIACLLQVKMHLRDREEAAQLRAEELVSEKIVVLCSGESGFRWIVYR